MANSLHRYSPVHWMETHPPHLTFIHRRQSPHWPPSLESPRVARRQRRTSVSNRHQPIPVMIISFKTTVRPIMKRAHRHSVHYRNPADVIHQLPCHRHRSVLNLFWPICHVRVLIIFRPCKHSSIPRTTMGKPPCLNHLHYSMGSICWTKCSINHPKMTQRIQYHHHRRPAIADGIMWHLIIRHELVLYKENGSVCACVRVFPSCRLLLFFLLYRDCFEIIIISGFLLSAKHRWMKTVSSRAQWIMNVA